MDCHTTTRGSIAGENGVKTKPPVLQKGHYNITGLPSLNDLAVGGTQNTTNKHRQFYILLSILQSQAAMPNSSSLMPTQMQFVPFYDGLWYDPARQSR